MIDKGISITDLDVKEFFFVNVVSSRQFTRLSNWKKVVKKCVCSSIN